MTHAVLRRGLVAPFVLAASLFVAPALAEPEGKSTGSGKDKSASALIQEGTSFHDAGRYDDAIARYRQALALEPGNSTALYELAFSYHAKKDYARCLEATREGLRRPGNDGARLYSQQGNCLDDAGRGAEAVANYREGLARHAHDGRLRYNYAVALRRQQQGAAAIPELVTAIGDEPGYASPYMLLAALHHEQQRDVQALFAFLRYLTIDRTSDRSRQAATLALDLFTRGVTTKPSAGKDGKLDVEIAISPDALGAGGLYSTLEVPRSLAAASVHSGDGETEADRVAGALATFLAMSSELAAAPEHAETTRSAEWRLVTVPLLELAERDLAAAFGHLVAERAKVAGGSEWVEKNSAAMRQLEAAFASGVAAAAP
jgi:tetratricopeptide (TPR) repeat protein